MACCLLTLQHNYATSDMHLEYKSEHSSKQQRKHYSNVMCTEKIHYRVELRHNAEKVGHNLMYIAHFIITSISVKVTNILISVFLPLPNPLLYLTTYYQIHN